MASNKAQFVEWVKQDRAMDNVIFEFAEIFPEEECPYLRDIFGLVSYDILEAANVKIKDHADSN